jgi:hypothetical protein
MNEINSATAPPVVPTTPVGAGVGAPPPTPIGAGLLFGNADVDMIKDRLVNLVTAVVPGNSGYTSLSQLGLELTSSFTQLQETSTTGSTGSQSNSITTTSSPGTDGTFQPLDQPSADYNGQTPLQVLQSALAANPNAVQNLLNGAQGLVTQMGTYLTGVTGLPTQTETGLVGTIPSTSLLQGFENANNSQVDSIQQQISMIQESANMQADQLRAEFVQTESTLAGYQALQQQLGSFFNGSGG